MSQLDELYFKRCYDLALIGGRATRPNPMVGCVIVHEDRIIGEGYHKLYGTAHAEVNAISSIKTSDLHLLPTACAYISLEPCHHTGKTPPCVDLLIAKKIGQVKIALTDPTEKVNRKSVAKLIDHKIDVSVLDDVDLAEEVVREFVSTHIKGRPYVQLKFAKSKYNYIGAEDGQVHLTNRFTNVLTHKMRAYTDAILIGTNTAEIDDPGLTLRHYPGVQPLRIVLDREGRLSKDLQLFTDQHRTLVITSKKELAFTSSLTTVLYLDFAEEGFLGRLLAALKVIGVNHLMVEGGAALLSSFVKQNLWDEAIVISTNHELGHGSKAPNINGRSIKTWFLDEDTILQIRPSLS